MAQCAKKSFLMDQINALFCFEIPLMYKNLGCASISCVIGQYNIEKALLVLGASVNQLLSLQITRSWGLGEFKPIPVVL